MKHLFVTYEIAKLLKEKGFNEMCFAYYPSTCLNPDLLIPSQYKETAIFYDRPHNTLTLAPMHQQVIDFLREKHDLVISTRRDGGYWIIDVVDISDEDSSSPFNRTDERALGSDYYAMLNEAIIKALNLIKN